MFRRHLLSALVLGAIATSLVGCKSGSSTSSTSPVDLSPPQAPSNLHSISDARISREWLVWDASASATAAQYEIYSSPTSTASGTLVATVDANSMDYLLPLTNISSTEFYRVRAVGSNAVPSAFTSSVGVDRTAWEGNTFPNKDHGKDSGF